MMLCIPFFTAMAVFASTASSAHAEDDKAAPTAREYVLTVEGMT